MCVHVPALFTLRYNLLRAMIIESFDGDTCPQCGATVNGDMEFCEECGTRLRSTQAQIQLYEDQGTQDVTYDDDGAGAQEGQIYDDDEQQPGGEQIYDDDDAPQLPVSDLSRDCMLSMDVWEGPPQQPLARARARLVRKLARTRS